MSLRSQIRHAVDDVSPPSPDLERKVRAFVIGDRRERAALRLWARRSPWMYRVQGAATLLAAVLVVALIAGLFFGGRIWRDLNAAPATISQQELKGLEQRSLNFPTLEPGATCPKTPLTLNHSVGMVVGEGPIYLINGDIYERGDWGSWVAVGFASQGEKPGLVLVRAKDLQSGSQVAFAQYPLAPTGMTAVGRVIGSDRVVDHKVQLRSEAVFHDPWPYVHSVQPIELVVLVGVAQGGSGCIGFQVDGPDFAENFVVELAWPTL